MIERYYMGNGSVVVDSDLNIIKFKKQMDYTLLNDKEIQKLHRVCICGEGSRCLISFNKNWEVKRPDKLIGCFIANVNAYNFYILGWVYDENNLRKFYVNSKRHYPDKYGRLFVYDYFEEISSVSKEIEILSVGEINIDRYTVQKFDDMKNKIIPVPLIR